MDDKTIDIAWLENEKTTIELALPRFAADGINVVVVEGTIEAFGAALSVARSEERNVDVVLLDLLLHETEQAGSDAIPIVKETFPKARMAVFTNQPLSSSAFGGVLFDNGVAGWFDKMDGLTPLIDGLRGLAAGDATAASPSGARAYTSLHQNPTHVWTWFSPAQIAFLKELARTDAMSKTDFTEASSYAASTADKHFNAIRQILRDHEKLGADAEMKWHWLRDWAKQHNFDLRSPKRDDL